MNCDKGSVKSNSWRIRRRAKCGSLARNCCRLVSCPPLSTGCPANIQKSWCASPLWTPRTLEFPELHERKVDLVLARIRRTFVNEDLNIEILLDDPLFVVAGAHSRWARRRKITLGELAKEPWIFPPNHVVMELIRAAFEAHSLEVPSESVSAASILLRHHLLATGRFLTMLPDSVLHYTAKPRSLKVLPIDLRIKPWPLAILTLKHRTLSPVVQLFTEQLRAVAKTITSRQR